MNNWEFEGKEIKSLQDAPEGVVGFIYIITNIESGRRYIGKKYIYSEKKVNMNKKEIAALTNKRLRKWRMVKKEAEWLSYMSSSEEIKKEYAEGVKFKKEIVMWTFSKLQTYYEEVKLQFQNNVLESDDWYNKNIASKWFKGNLK